MPKRREHSYLFRRLENRKVQIGEILDSPWLGARVGKLELEAAVAGQLWSRLPFVSSVEDGKQVTDECAVCVAEAARARD